MASTAAVLNILVNAQTGTAQAQLTALDAKLKQTAATATGTSGAMGKWGKGAIGAAGAITALGAAAVIVGKQLYDLGSEFDDAYDSIRTGTGATGKELKRLKASFKDVAKTVPNDLRDVGDAVADLNTRMGLSGKPLEDMAESMLHLSNLTGTDLKGNIKSVARAFVDWEVPVKRQTAALDGLFRLSQESGASVSEIADNIQKFGSPLRTLGLDIDYAAAMFATFERAGVNMQTMVPGLKLAIGNMTDPTDELGAKFKALGVNANDLPGGLKKIFAALGNKGDLSNIEKRSLAMETFGKRAGADMLEAVRQGRFNVQRFMDVFNDGKNGDSIRKAAEDTYDFSENMRTVGNNLKVAFEPAASAVFNAMTEISRVLANADFSAFAENFRKAMSMLAPAAEPVLRVAGKLWNALAGEDDKSRIQMLKESANRAVAILAGTSQRVVRLRRRVSNATDREREAEAALRRARKQHGSGSNEVVEAEIRLHRAKRKTIRLTNEAKNAERKQGIEREIAVSRLRDSAIFEKARIGRMNRHIKQLERQRNLEWQRNGDSDALREKEAQLTEKLEQRRKAQKRLNNTLGDAVTQIGPKFARSLRDMSDKTARLATQLPQLKRPTDNIRRSWKQVLPTFEDVGRVSKRSFGTAEDSVDKYAATMARKRAKVNENMRAMPPVQRVATSTMMDLFREAMGALDDGGTPRQANRAGGVIRRVFKKFSGGGMVPAAVSPGEEIRYKGTSAVVPGRPVAQDSVHMDLPVGAKVFTWDGRRRLAEGASESEALRKQRPHFNAGGIVKPVISGGSTKARELANKAVGNIHEKATNKYKRAKLLSQRGGGGSWSGGSGQYPGVSGDTDFMPALGMALSKMGKAAGQSIYVQSGWRSYAEQAALYEAYLNGTGNLAAPPGSSNHESGRAADITPGSEVFGSLASKFGLGFTVPSESWHIELLRRGGMVGKLARMARGGRVRMQGGGGVPSAFDIWNNNQLASLAHAVGMKGPGLMAQIANGESSGNPNTVGNDAAAGYGDTFGYGLWQITSRYHDDKIAAAGGAGTKGKGIFDPIKNAKAAKMILDTEGLGAWYADPRGPKGKVIPSLAQALRKMAEKDGYLSGGGAPQVSPSKKRMGERNGMIDKLRAAVKKAKTPERRQAALWDLVGAWGKYGNLDKDAKTHMIQKVAKAARVTNPLGNIPVLQNLATWLRKNVKVHGKEEANEDFVARMQKAENKGSRIAGKKRKSVLSDITGRGFDFPLKGSLRKNKGLLARMAEDIELKERDAGAEFGPGGSEYTDAELKTIVSRYKWQLKWQNERKNMIARTLIHMRAVRDNLQQKVKESSEAGSPLAWKRGAFKKALTGANRTIGESRTGMTELIGLTGKGGAISDTRFRLKELGATTTTEGSRDSELAALLREQLNVANRNNAILTAQMPIYQQFMPRYHTGGVIPGRTETPIMAMGGEGVFTREQMAAMGGPGNITVVIEDGAVDRNAIRVEVDGVLAKHISSARRSSGGRKYATNG